MRTKILSAAIAFCIVLAAYISLPVFAEEVDPTTPPPTTTTTKKATTTAKPTTTTKKPTTTAKPTTTTKKATTTTKKSTTVTTPKPTTPKPTTTARRSVKFKDGNPSSVIKQKSITLTIETSGISSLNTKFKSADTTIASVEKVNNTNVKVYGLREGTVDIVATCGDITAKFKITVKAEGEATGSEELDVSSVPDNALGVASEAPVITKAEFQGELVVKEDVLAAVSRKQSTDVFSNILGIIGWGLLIVLIMIVFTTIMRNRNPRSSRFPGGARSRYGKHYRRSRHLLPDHYYRGLKKW
ncbi:MAG: hypothetical protein LBS74_05825 [Oscillospiraceae bacterium]|jgi:hypothetical protein|nr:hypothetical protein [Oscillospiraceae bacterium]